MTIVALQYLYTPPLKMFSLKINKKVNVVLPEDVILRINEPDHEGLCLEMIELNGIIWRNIKFTMY